MTKPEYTVPKDTNKTNKNQLKSSKKLPTNVAQDADSLDSYVRIGTEYYRMSKDTEEGRKLHRWKKETIKDDFATSRNKEPHKDVRKFVDVINYPDNLNYQEEIKGRFNLYNPLTHQPRAGNCDTILNLISHLTSQTESPNQDTEAILLDWLTLLYRQPRQILPILAFISTERETGKTTFLNLLKAIFQGNAVVLNNESFQKAFNAHYSTKLIVGIDEMFQDGEKKQQIERIKEMVTAKKAMLEMKFSDSKEVDNYKKLVMCLNDPENLWIPEEETRYFVLKVKPFAKKVPGAWDRMLEELPAFLHLLQTRELKHKEAESRAWFPDQVLKTDALKEIQANSKPVWQKVIDEYLSDAFEAFEVDELYYTAQDLAHEIKRRNSYGIQALKIKKYLKEERKMQTIYEQEGKQKNYKFYCLSSHEMHNAKQGEFAPLWKKASYYIFKREEWKPSSIRKMQKNEIDNKEYEDKKKLPV